MNIFINQSLPGGHFKRGVSPDPRVATVEKKEPINDLTLFRLNKTISCMYTILNNICNLLWNHSNPWGSVFEDCKFCANSWGCHFVDT